MVPGTGIEPVRPLFTKRRILSPLCLPISPSRHKARTHCQTKKPPIVGRPCVKPTVIVKALQKPKSNGGAGRSRTDLLGFAIRYITALLPRRTDLITAITCRRANTLRTIPTKKDSILKCCPLNWSGRRVSNSRPQPWQGCALPTELLPR